MTLPTEFLAGVAETLERLGIPYHVGGSLASSFHGIYRTSADIDFVIDPTREQLAALGRALLPDFYVSETAMNEAFAARGTFNAIHAPTSFKIDFFLKGRSAFDAEEQRRSSRQVVTGESARLIFIKSAEDTVLRKLDWYRKGGETSERQWQDVRSILAANRGALDEQHLDRWAEVLGVADLLARARGEAAKI
jgi:predicted nucleotidyltransferase